MSYYLAFPVDLGRKGLGLWGFGVRGLSFGLRLSVEGSDFSMNNEGFRSKGFVFFV